MAMTMAGARPSLFEQHPFVRLLELPATTSSPPLPVLQVRFVNIVVIFLRLVECDCIAYTFFPERSLCQNPPAGRYGILRRISWEEVLMPLLLNFNACGINRFDIHCSLS